MTRRAILLLFLLITIVPSVLAVDINSIFFARDRFEGASINTSMWNYNVGTPTTETGTPYEGSKSGQINADSEEINGDTIIPSGTNNITTMQVWLKAYDGIAANNFWIHFENSAGTTLNRLKCASGTWQWHDTSVNTNVACTSGNTSLDNAWTRLKIRVDNLNNILGVRFANGSESNTSLGADVRRFGIRRSESGTARYRLDNFSSWDYGLYGWNDPNETITPPVTNGFDKVLGGITYNDTALETSLQYYHIVTSFNNSRYSNATAILNWNGTELGSMQYLISNISDETNITFRSQRRLPLVQNNATDVTFFWNVTFINATGGSPNATLNNSDSTITIAHAYTLSIIGKKVYETDDVRINLTINTSSSFASIKPYMNYTSGERSPTRVLSNISTQIVYELLNGTGLNGNASQHNETKTIGARIELFDSNNSIRFNRTISGTVPIYTMRLLQTCTVGDFVQNFTYRDVDNPASSLSSQSDFVYDIYLNRSRGERNFSFSLSAATHHDFCISPDIPVGKFFYNDLDLTGTVAGFGSVGFFQDNNTVTSGFLQNTTIYFQAGDKNITIEVVDENENPLRNHQVIAENFIVANNTFFQTNSDITDINGKVRLSLVSGTTQYRFIIKNPSGSTLLTSVPFKLLEDTYRFRVTLVQFDILQNIQGFRNMPHNLTYDNGTKLVNLNWSDTQGIASDVCLKVHQLNASNVNVLFNYCDNENNTGVITYDLSAFLNGTFQAIAYGHAATSGSLFNIDVLDIFDEIEQPFRQLGLLLGFFIILLMGGLAMTGNPATLIIVSSFGLIFAVITQMWIIGFSVVAGLIFIGIIAAIKSRV